MLKKHVSKLLICDQKRIPFYVMCFRLTEEEKARAELILDDLFPQDVRLTQNTQDTFQVLDHQEPSRRYCFRSAESGQVCGKSFFRWQRFLLQQHLRAPC